MYKSDLIYVEQSRQAWSSLVTPIPTHYNKMLLIVLCAIFGPSWQFNENPFIFLLVMLLPDAEIFFYKILYPVVMQKIPKMFNIFLMPCSAYPKNFVKYVCVFCNVAHGTKLPPIFFYIFVTMWRSRTPPSQNVPNCSFCHVQLTVKISWKSLHPFFRIYQTDNPTNPQRWRHDVLHSGSNKVSNVYVDHGMCRMP